jgi:hypothetical protein
MSGKPFIMLYASPNQIGKATAQAMELAERARQHTSIEIQVVPVMELQELREKLAKAEEEIEALRAEIYELQEIL